MQFIDHTGHLFYMNSYASKPIGYEYETTPYIFWLNDEYSHKLSVDNYYVLPIRIVFKNITTSQLGNLEVSLDSNVFSLYGSKLVDGFDIDSPEYIHLSEESLKTALSFDDFEFISGLTNESDTDDTYTFTTFYVFANASEEGSWMTNIMIKASYTGDFNDDFNDDFYNSNNDESSEWCPITVGGIFVDEREELIINGRNIGVSLPKDIIKAVYQGSYINDIYDDNLYNQKLKEYLINHMVIKGECGNFDSAISSLKWFGWGEHVTLSKLMQTDNQFADQYVHNYFDLNTDIIKAFKYFKQTTYLALRLADNQESGEYNKVDFTEDFHGEGKPILEDLFSKLVERRYDELDISFWRPYYDFAFNELGLKLACLAYMYDKYFLPIHINIHSASITHQVFANDMKMLYGAHTKISETPILIGNDNNTRVKFENKSTYYLYNQKHIIDTDYNEFDIYTEEYAKSKPDETFLYVNDICFSIPIGFMCLDNDPSKEIYKGIYDCNLLLIKDGDILYESKFAFSDEKERYTNLVIVPTLFDTKFDATYWENSSFDLYILCNDVWYHHSFDVKIPEFKLRFGSIEYNYYDGFDENLNKITRHTQIQKIDDDTKNVIFNSFMYVPSLATTSNIKFIDELVKNIDKDNTIIGAENHTYLNAFIEKYKENPRIVDSSKYFNRIYIYNIYWKGSAGQGTKIEYDSSYNMEGKTGSIVTESTYNLYKKFFNNDGTQKIEMCTNKSDKFPVDFYLMHDDTQWYGVYISRLTKSDIETPGDDDPLKTIVSQNTQFVLKLYKQDSIFLIDRMKFYDACDINHFESDDIIIASIDNVNFPYIMSLGSKWEFNKFSIGSPEIDTVYSKSNSAIVSLNPKYFKYASGYYNVIVNYSIDAFNQHNRTAIAKFRVN